MSEGKRTPIVIVLGMHRSGTSLCAHVLSALGFDMADEITPHDSNAKGHWERLELVAYHDRILKLFGRDWLQDSHAIPLPMGWWFDPAVRSISREMTGWLRDHMGTSRRFGFKDPRTSLMLPLWKEVLLDLDLEPRYLFCLRHPTDVARSLAARRDVPDPSQGEHRWLNYNTQIVVGLASQSVSILPFEDWFAAGSQNLARIRRHLNIDGEAEGPNLKDLVGSIVEPSLNHRLTDNVLRSSAISEALYKDLIGSVDAGKLLPNVQDVAAACFRFERFIEPIRRTAMRVSLLEAEIAARDCDIAGAATELDTLRVALTAEVSRFDLATSQMEELRNQLIVRDSQLANATERELELRAELVATRSQMGTLVAEIEELRQRAVSQSCTAAEAATSEEA